MFDPRRLQALAAVVETGSVRAAAARLGFTPSAISQHVSMLERQTGLVLLEPAGRGVRPTAAGLLLAKRGQELLQHSAEVAAELASLAAGRLGTLRVGAIGTTGPQVVAPALAHVRRALPDLALEARVAETDEAIALLVDGAIDVAVVEVHDDPVDLPRALTRVPLLEDPFQVVLPRGHPLSIADVVRLADAADEAWIDMRSEVNCCRAATDAAFTAAGFEPRRSIEADDYGPAQDYVAAGLGLALIPRVALGVVTRPGIESRRLSRDAAASRRLEALARTSTFEAAPVAILMAGLKGISEALA